MTGTYWENAAQRSHGQFTCDELEAAAYRLVAEQVLYHADIHSRSAYWAIERNEKEYRSVLAPLGLDVHIDRSRRFAYALPRHAKSGTATVGQTLFALVLRVLYDEAARAGQRNDHAEAGYDLVEIEERYRQLVGREFPSKGRLDALMNDMKRWGLARKADESELEFADGAATGGQPYAVLIRPAIQELLSETALARLAEFRDSGTLASPVASEALDAADSMAAMNPSREVPAS